MTEFAQNLDKQLNRIGKEFQSVINRFSTGSAEASIPRFYPVADMMEDDETITISIDLPGLSKKDITLAWTEGELRIEGTRPSGPDLDAKFRIRERGHGDFSRSFSLPAITDEKSIKAKFTNGVLRISISKTETRKSKTSIPID